MESSLQTGAVLFASDTEKLAVFYEQVAGLVILSAADDHVVLERGSYQLIIHSIPADQSAGEQIQSPREGNPVKLVFFIGEIATARLHADKLGGSLS